MSFQREFIILVLLILSYSAIGSMPPVSSKVNCVVIDAGHGGTDPGAIGYFKTKEKDVTLSIALKIGKLINENYPDVKVIYTRKTDVFVELFKRADIANKNHADLFISIHCNAAPKTTAFGAETFVMGNHKSAANLEVAKKENAAILLEDDYIDKYDGFNPNSAEAYIIFSLFQNAYLNNSLALATSVQRELAGKIKFFDRGIKQAGFLVLYKTAMPGILVETGFISNPNDESYLKSEKGQTAIAQGLVNAFAHYKHTVEGGSESTFKPIYTDLYKYSEVKVPIDSSKIVKKKDTLNIKTDDLTNKFIQHNAALDSNLLYQPKNQSDSSIVFKIQFYTCPEDKPLDSKEFSKIPNVGKYFQNGLYKFTAGSEKNIEGANAVLKQVKSLGYQDAFIIAFKGNLKIPTSEAIKLTKTSN